MGSLLVAAAIGGGAWWLAGHLPAGGSQETVEAQHFVVRDAQGAARAVFEQSAGGSTQLVFFRDPLAGEEWRKHNNGPFNFGVRAMSGSQQMVLWASDGGNLQLSPAGLFFNTREKPWVVLEASRPSRLWLADSTGNMNALTSSLLADLAARSAAKTTAPPKHRRKR